MSETLIYIIIFAALMFFMHRGHGGGMGGCGGHNHNHSNSDRDHSTDKNKVDEQVHHH